MTYQYGRDIFIHGNSSALWYDVEKETFKDSGLTLKNNYLGYEHLTSAIQRDRRHIYFIGGSFVNVVDFENETVAAFSDKGLRYARTSEAEQSEEEDPDMLHKSTPLCKFVRGNAKTPSYY